MSRDVYIAMLKQLRDDNLIDINTVWRLLDWYDMFGKSLTKTEILERYRMQQPGEVVRPFRMETNA